MNTKLALLEIDFDAVLSKSLKKLPDVLFVLLGGRAGNQDVIQIPKTKVQPTDDPVNEALKGLGGVAQTEWHADVLEETEGRGDGRLRNVFGSNWDLMICPHEVDLVENQLAIEG